MTTEDAASPLVELNVRGKRRARERNSATGSVRSRGRPLKRASELATKKKRARVEVYEAPTEQKRAMANSKPRDKVSEIERLPVELIQQIFLHALELNMPRASTILARCLSEESIYSSLILLAFFDDDGMHPVHGKHFAPAQYRELDLAEKLRLQTSVLDSRWCTLQRLQQNLPALSRLATVQAWHEEYELLVELQTAETDPEAPPITPSLPQRAIASLPTIEDIEATEKHFLARSTASNRITCDKFNESGMYLPRLRTWTSSEGKDGRIYKTFDSARGIFNVRYIPSRLLRGSPWTAEKLTFLKFLRQGWRFLQKDFVLKISPVALFEGMASAITESNSEALSVLLELHFAAFQDEASHTSFTASGRIHYAVSFSRPIPVELFHLATRQRNSAELISLLLREGIDSIQDDAILTKWALGARYHHDSNKLAEWLLRHMEGTESYGLNGESLFLNGNMTWRRAAGNYPFPERSFTDELDYLTDGALWFRPEIIKE